MSRGTRVVIGLVVVVLVAAAGATGWLVATRPYHRASAAALLPTVHCGYLPSYCQHGRRGQRCIVGGEYGHVITIRINALGVRRKSQAICRFGPTARHYRLFGLVDCEGRLPGGAPGNASCKFGRAGEKCTVGEFPGVIKDQTGTLYCDTSPPTPPPAGGVTGSCQVGYETVSSGGSSSGVFIPGHVPASYYGNQGADAATAYQMTITNGTSATIDVTGFATVFYGSGGTETGSDPEQGFRDNFITVGQALVWTVEANTTVNGNGDDSSGYSLAAVPDGSDTCQMVQWYHP